MNCKEIRERMPEVAAGFGEFAADESKHLESCGTCVEELKALRATMALLDEWQAPEPSPYFDTRLQARLREEQAHQAAGWWAWLRRAALAGAMAVLLVGGISFWRIQHGVQRGPIAQNIVAIQAEPGTAVGDLQ